MESLLKIKSTGWVEIILLVTGLVEDFDKQIQGVFKGYSRTKTKIFKVNPVWQLVHSQHMREYTVIQKSSFSLPRQVLR